MDEINLWIRRQHCRFRRCCCHCCLLSENRCICVIIVAVVVPLGEYAVGTSVMEHEYIEEGLGDDEGQTSRDMSICPLDHHLNRSCSTRGPERGR